MFQGLRNYYLPVAAAATNPAAAIDLTGAGNLNSSLIWIQIASSQPGYALIGPTNTTTAVNRAAGVPSAGRLPDRQVFFPGGFQPIPYAVRADEANFISLIRDDSATADGIAIITVGVNNGA